jgi:hypothetical protein
MADRTQAHQAPATLHVRVHPRHIDVCAAGPGRRALIDRFVQENHVFMRHRSFQCGTGCWRLSVYAVGWVRRWAEQVDGVTVDWAEEEA